MAGLLLAAGVVVTGELVGLHATRRDIANGGDDFVVGVDAPHPLVGFLTRGDILSAHKRRLKGAREGGRHIRIRETLRRYTT
jgi:hypothetical protein